MTFPVQAWHYLVNAADPRPFTFAVDATTLRVGTAAGALVAFGLGAAAAPLPLWIALVVLPALYLGYTAARRALRARPAASPPWAAREGAPLAAVSFAGAVLATALSAALEPAIGDQAARGLFSIGAFAVDFGIGASYAVRRR